MVSGQPATPAKLHLKEDFMNMTGLSSHWPQRLASEPALLKPQHARENSATAARGIPAEIATEFEGLVLSQLLQQMRTAGGEEAALFPGDTSDTLGGLFDQYLGQFLAARGGLGLARQWTGSRSAPVVSGNQVLLQQQPRIEDHE
jgi:hypothetical protein